MSLVISTTTPEGIVIAADSRQSYRNRLGMGRIGSDNANKLFQVNSRIAVAITGLAFLEDEGVLKNISYYIDEFKSSERIEELSVINVSEELHKLFLNKYKPEEQFISLETKIKNDLEAAGKKNIKFTRKGNNLFFEFIDAKNILQNGTTSIDNISFLVAGYNPDKSFEVYTCYIPGQILKVRNSKMKGMEYGANWLGQTDVVSRIILGFDPRISNTKCINDTITRVGSDNFKKEMQNIQYLIQWGTMTLQDAIDFADLMIKTTSAIQRFSDGIFAIPGEMPGVGGEVDIAIITQEKGFIWISKKKLIHQGRAIDIDII